LLELQTQMPKLWPRQVAVQRSYGQFKD